MPDTLRNDPATRITKKFKREIRNFIEHDDERESAPHEHTLTFLGAIGLAVCALNAPTRGKAVCHGMLAGVLLLRAVSGRDGIRRWVGAKPPRHSALDEDIPYPTYLSRR